MLRIRSDRVGSEVISRFTWGVLAGSSFWGAGGGVDLGGWREGRVVGGIVGAELHTAKDVHRDIDFTLYLADLTAVDLEGFFQLALAINNAEVLADELRRVGELYC